MKTRSEKDSAPQFPYFTMEHKLIRKTVKRFCLEEIAPHAQKWDEECEFPREIFKQAAELGLFGIRIDPRWGGGGLDWWATTAMYEEMGCSESTSVNMALMVHADLTCPVIEKLGTEEQKQEFLVPAVRGEKLSCLGISEPEAGSDVSAIRTVARADGDDLVITGQKLWITNGTRADFILLAVRTGEEGHKGLSFVLFPTDTKGFSVGKKISKIGMMASDTAELFFDECRIPARYLLGEKNRGFYYVMENFQGERLAGTILAFAAASRALQLARDYGTKRSVFGRPVLKYQVWRHKLAEHLASMEAGRWLVYRAVDLVNRAQPATKEITMAKLFVTELAQKVLYDCGQMFGGFGYTTDYPIGRLWRDVRLFTIGAGTSEVMKEIIAKEEGF